MSDENKPHELDAVLNVDTTGCEDIFVPNGAGNKSEKSETQGEPAPSQKGEVDVPCSRKVAECEAAIAKATAYQTDRSKSLPMGGFVHVKTKVDKDGNVMVCGLMPTMQNLEHLLKGYGITYRYNEMTRLREVSVPGLGCSADNLDDRVVDEIDNLAVLNGLTFTTSRLNGYLSTLAERDCYHPVRQWIESKPWDGISRFQALADTLAVTTEEYADHRNRMLKRWLISAIAALFSKNPNDKFELVLTFQGAQGKKKTTWFKRLAQADIGAVLDGMKLNPNEKDCVFTFAGHWIVEMGEIENTFSKTELGSIKAFLSKSFDMLRRPYAKFDSRMKRQTVSGATVNKPDFLVDETGNRRFLTVPIRSVDGYHTVDMQQLWAEVKAVWYDKGEQHWLTDEEDKALAEINERFEAVQPIRELLVDAFDFGSDPCAEPVRLTATKALVLFNLPRDQKNVSAAGAALRKLTGEEPKSFGGARCWKVGLRRESSYFEQAKLLMV